MVTPQSEPGGRKGSPPERGGPGPCRDPSAHPVEPGAQRHVNADGPGPSEQDHEGRLERVLNIMGIVQVASADAQDHRAMALDDRLERRLRGPRGPFRPVVPLQETIEQFRVGQPRGAPDGKERAQEPCVAHPALLESCVLTLCPTTPCYAGSGRESFIFPGDPRDIPRRAAPAGPGTQGPAPPRILTQNVDPRRAGPAGAAVGMTAPRWSGGELFASYHPASVRRHRRTLRSCLWPSGVGSALMPPHSF